MKMYAIVPLKRLREAKSRLSDRLSPGQRRSLVREMLCRVLATLISCRSRDLLADVALVSNDVEARTLAQGLGAKLLPDPAGHLNGALEAARTTLTGEGAAAMLIVPADLPLLTVDDVRQLLLPLANGADGVLAPDAAGCGTNALALRLPSRLPFGFGADSAPVHRSAAARLGLQLDEYTSSTLALDVDTIENLEQYRALVPARPQIGAGVAE